MTLCPLCEVNPAGPHGEMCNDCSMTALRAYGWAQGTPMGGGILRRGPEDPDARKELDALIDRRIRLATQVRNAEHEAITLTIRSGKPGDGEGSVLATIALPPDWLKKP